MWSWANVKVPTPAVAERSSMISEPISDFRQMRLHRVPARPAFAPVKAQQLAAVAGDDLVDPRGGIARHMDLHRHDGFKQDRRALRHALGHGHARRRLEGHFGGVDIVVGAVRKIDVEIDHRKAQRPVHHPFAHARSTAGIYCLGTTPPVIVSVNTKPEPRGSGLISTTTSPYWPWPPDCFLCRPRSCTDLRIVSL